VGAHTKGATTDGCEQIIVVHRCEKEDRKAAGSEARSLSSKRKTVNESVSKRQRKGFGEKQKTAHTSKNPASLGGGEGGGKPNFER